MQVKAGSQAAAANEKKTKASGMRIAIAHWHQIGTRRETRQILYL
jgi:hypothetical protein